MTLATGMLILIPGALIVHLYPKRTLFTLLTVHLSMQGNIPLQGKVSLMKSEISSWEMSFGVIPYTFLRGKPPY